MKYLVFQHVDVEHPGVFRDFWKEAGITYDAVELDAGDPIPPLDRYDVLLAMGGPMDVWEVEEHPWLVPELAAIRQWVTEVRRPFLGICLGHQLLAAAMGGSLAPAAVSEVGFTPVTFTPEGRADPIFAGFGDGMDTFQWHSTEVTRLPEGAVVLASNDACAVQAFRLGTLSYGLQYHVELTDRTVPEWQAIPAYAASLEEALGRDGAAHLPGDVAARLPAFNDAARKLDANFRAIIDSHLVPAVT